jgi:hypothetical protein
MRTTNRTPAPVALTEFVWQHPAGQGMIDARAQ